MEDNYVLSNCNDHEVLLFNSTTLKVDQLRIIVSELFSKDQLGQQITELLSPIIGVSYIDKGLEKEQVTSSYEQWFNEGVECEILKLGAWNWQKGRVRIKLNVSLEFCHQELEAKNFSVNDRQVNQSESFARNS